MNKMLPELDSAGLGPTRDCLREVALVLGRLQRAFLPENPRQWEHGLEVTMRGISTQALKIGDEEVRASIDLVRGKVRLGNDKWPLKEIDGPALLKILQEWLVSKGIDVEIDPPKFDNPAWQIDKDQVVAYADALWWIDERFRQLKASLAEGVTSPILLYPHHFDLSLVWFPYDDERQLGLGFSTGDENVAEPYLYLTAYPEPAKFTDIKLPAGAHGQKDGFSGAVLPYAKLQASADPEGLFEEFAAGTFAAARPLFD
jgi:hypothetical protein